MEKIKKPSTESVKEPTKILVTKISDVYYAEIEGMTWTKKSGENPNEVLGALLRSCAKQLEVEVDLSGLTPKTPSK